jgi:hypothetical protein
MVSLSEEQYRVLVWTVRGSSIFSMLGSFFVVTTFLFSSRFQSSINRLIFYASWGNILTNTGSLMSRAPIERGPDSSFCQFQGFMLQWYGYLFQARSLYIARADPKKKKKKKVHASG